MKLNLKCGNNIKKECLNIDIHDIANISEQIYVKGNYLNLDWICGDSYVEELFSNEAICSANLMEIEPTLQNWYNKITRSGYLYMQIVDAYTLSKLMYNNQIDIKQFNQIIYTKKSLLDTDSMLEILKHIGFQDLSLDYNNIYINIRCYKK